MKINKEQVVGIIFKDAEVFKLYKYQEEKVVKFFGFTIETIPSGFSSGPLMPFYKTEKEFTDYYENCFIENKVVYCNPSLVIITSDGNERRKFFKTKTERDGYFHNNLSDLNLIDY